MAEDSRKRDTTEFSDLELLDGIRIKRQSVKIYKRFDGKFLIILKKYFFKYPFSEQRIVVDTYEEAEDYLVDLKFEKKVGQRMPTHRH